MAILAKTPDRVLKMTLSRSIVTFQIDYFLSIILPKL